MDAVIPPAPYNAPVEWPPMSVEKVSHPYLQATVQHALSAYIAGLVQKPETVRLLTTSVEVIHRMVQDELRFCWIFFLYSGARVDSTDTVMVRVASEPPSAAQQLLNDCVPMQAAEVFVWTGQAWHHAFKFEHRASRQPEQPMLDTPKNPTFPLPDPLSGI